MLSRVASLVASLWLGLVITIGAVAAPAAFAVLARADAGRLVALIFRIEAQLSLAIGLLLFLMHRKLGARSASSGRASVFSTELLWVMSALFCTVLGHFGLQPMMEAARGAQGPWSFGVLHGVSSALFAVKGLALMALVWRCTAPPVGP